MHFEYKKTSFGKYFSTHEEQLKLYPQNNFAFHFSINNNTLSFCVIFISLQISMIEQLKSIDEESLNSITV